MKTKKMLFCAVLFLAAAGLFAQKATIKDFYGTVEIKLPSSPDWKPASKGQEITGDTAISTGFKSTAIVSLGNSTLTMRPLTRLTLAELSNIQNDEKVELKLNAGKVRAEVNAPRGGKTNFTVRSPTATASVRGTVFEIDAFNLKVNEGTVEFMGASGGGAVLVDAGGASFVDENSGRAAPPQELAVAELKPELPSGVGTAVSEESLTNIHLPGKNITIKITFEK